MKIYAISESQLENYLHNRERAEQGIDISFFVNKRKEAKLENGIGHVHIYGALLPDAAPIDRKLGNTDYKDIVNDVNSMINQGAKAILLEINSGGGAVLGCVEAAEFIQNLSVPVVTHVDGDCASAAYKIASGSTYIVATKSSINGNIGAISVHLDSSAIKERMGLRYVTFVNEGAIYKSTGHTDTLSQEQAEYLQARINKAGEDFQNHVRANRSPSEEVFTAAWYTGQEAVDVGLVDEIGSLETAIQRAQELIEFNQPEEEEIDTTPIIKA